MTPETVQDAIDHPGVTVRLSENGHYYFAAKTITVLGQAISVSIRLPINPSPFEIGAARIAFEEWEGEMELTGFNLTGEVPN